MTDLGHMELSARALCHRKGINPDQQCHAMTAQTERRLGKTYLAWQYQAADLDWLFGLQVKSDLSLNKAAEGEIDPE